MRSTERRGGAARGDEERGVPAPASTAIGRTASDRRLRRARTRHLVTTGLFAVVLGVGVVTLLGVPSRDFPLVPVALIVLGGINGAVSAGALWRVLGEQRTRERDRREAGATPADGFDQTNGVVDLGTESERPDPDDALNRARRLSSMNAAGIAYSNGSTH